MSTTTTDTNQGAAKGHDHHDHHEHHIVDPRILHGVFVALLVLTAITYLASTVHMGRTVNIIVAMLIACVKAGLVATFFMHLRWDKPFNTVVLLVSIGFLGLFLTIATLDTSENEWRKDAGFAESRMKSMREEAQSKQPEPLYHPKHDLLLRGAGDEVGSAGPVDERTIALHAWAKSELGALPAEATSNDNPITPEKVALGKALFFETRMSKGQALSCNSCHGLDTFGVDGKVLSPGHKGQVGTRNTPTVLNAAFQTIGQFWDGREPTVEQQAGVPLTNPKEMAMAGHDQVVQVLRSIPGYEPMFKAAFPGEDQPITIENTGKAIGAFERRLVTPGRFDAFVNGDMNALTAAELDGLETFKEVGCQQCHVGPALGGTMLEKLGKKREYPTKDRGLGESTGRHTDMFMFKVPQLRNVSKTGPYFHDGSIKTLDEAVKLMAAHQLGQDLSDDQVQKIVTFLGSLDGQLSDPSLAVKPELPPSGPNTPKPDPN